MTIHKIITFVFVLTLSNFVQGTTKNDQSEFFVVMKKYVTGNCLSNWDIGNQFVNYEGIDCDEQGNVVKIDITGWSLSWQFFDDVCTYFPRLQILQLGYNNFQGCFPTNITNCSFYLIGIDSHDRVLIRGMPIDTCQSLRLARRLLPFAPAMEEKNGRNTLFSSTALCLIRRWNNQSLFYHFSPFSNFYTSKQDN
ncbi:hypothetical protein P3S68_027628 [Capsicum galapagoense]